ncbi:MAG: squalene/phytoene synthase family protein [Gammaproteobacteria bacterium]
MGQLNSTLNLALDFQNNILNKVSRSFALTIPQLPGQLKISVANGYLLCRITDTIEDDINLSIEQKAYFHEKFIDVLNEHFAPEQFIQELHPLLSEQTAIDEKLLILNLPKVLYVTKNLPLESQISIIKCVTIMNRGMLEFEKIININGLKNLLELEKYCYIVAGVVGEMLTELFCTHLNLSIEYKNKLMPLARSFGHALQMTNILKDRWSDYARKICYLPKELFAQLDFNALLNNLANNNINNNIDFINNIKKLINLNIKHFKNALYYILLIPKQETGIRRFCLWAIGMAVHLLQNINKNPGFTDVAQIKISRTKLKRIILITNIAEKSNYLLKLWFKTATTGLA